jgi:hypothetical protein
VLGYDGVSTLADAGGDREPEAHGQSAPPRSFGVFAPVGYLVIGFPGEAEAAQARAALLTGGYEQDEVMMFSSQQVIADIERTREDVSILAYMGAELGHQKQHLECARQGCAFLVVYAPSEAETTRVMNVARRFGARLAHKYNRLTVEELM